MTPTSTETMAGLVAGFQAFDASRWKHPAGVETVRHALHHYLQSTDGFDRGESDWALVQLTGITFEAVCRLLRDVLAPDEVLQALEIGLARAAYAVQQQPARGVEQVFGEWRKRYNVLVSFYVKHEDGDEFDRPTYVGAVHAFVDYLLQIAVVAMRMLVRYRPGIGPNDFNRGTLVLERFWIEAGQKRLTYLWGKAHSAPAPSAAATIAP